MSTGMTRTVLAVLLAASVAAAHGGSFRPPPGSNPGDPSGGPGGLTPVTGGGSGGGGGSPWTTWWSLHAERYLALRERLLRREVITGPKQRTDLFDRMRLREKVLAPLMLEALCDADEEVRTSAAVALGKFRTKQAVPLLREAFRKDGVQQVREAALLGLVLMRDPVLLDDLRGVALSGAHTRRERGFAVLGLGFLKDVDFLAKVMLGKGVHVVGSASVVEDVQACAALALGVSGERRAVGPLLAAARSRSLHKNVSGHAAAALGKIGEPIAAPDVVDLLMRDDTRPYVRYGAAVAVGALVGPDQRGLVDKIGRKSQRDKDDGIRSLLVISLGRIGGDVAASHLAGGMRKCPQRLRGYHYLALALTGHKDAGPLLLETFGKLKNNMDRSACALALGLCGYRTAAPVLRAEVERGNVAFTPIGLLALGLLDDAKSIPLVEKALQERDPLLLRQAALALALLRRSNAIPRLVEMLERSSSLFLRSSAVAALGMVGNEKAVEPLVRIYRDKSRQGQERALALAALGRIGDPARIPLLTRVAFDINPYPTIDAISEALRIL